MLTLCRTLMSMTILLYVDHELLIDPIPQREFSSLYGFETTLYKMQKDAW